MQRRTVRETDGDRRGKRWTRKLVIGFFALFALVVVLESPLSRVRAVTVTGNKSVSADAILKAAPLHKGMSLWQVNRGQINQDIVQQEPMVASVAVTTDYMNGQVVLHVTEKRVAAILESAGKFYNLLDDGKIYDVTSPGKGFPWPIITMASTAHSFQPGNVPDPSLAPLCQQLGRLSDAQTGAISEIHLNQYGEAQVYLNSGFVVDCKADSIGAAMNNVDDAVSYFLSKGYAPGLIDMTGAPPYRYTPFQHTQAKGSRP